MESYLVLVQALAVLRIMRNRCETRLRLLDEIEGISPETLKRVGSDLASKKEDLNYSVDFLERIVSDLRDDIK